MMGEFTLIDAYQKAEHSLQGHGRRNLDVLKRALSPWTERWKVIFTARVK